MGRLPKARKAPASRKTAVADASRPRRPRPLDRRRDHARGGADGVVVMLYGDYLCPYCRRLKPVLERLRNALGDRMTYVYRHFPNERAHPGAEFASIASEAAARQGKFWEMNFALYDHHGPVSEKTVIEIARAIGLDMARFRKDLSDKALKQRVDEDRADGRASGVTGTPTIFIDGVRYDGAWDFYSLLEAVERPLGRRLERAGRAFANLPTSAGLVLLAAAAAALISANTVLQPLYQHFLEARLGLGPPHGGLWLSVGEWCAEGLMAIFFLIVGLEIRRELTAGSLSDPRAAAGPVVAAVGGVVASAAVYLLVNPGPTARGWATPADTGFAFTLAILAIFGARASPGLKAFVAAYAVVDDILVILILAIFYPQNLQPAWFLGAAAAIGAMVLLNRWRIYSVWPYGLTAVGLWLMLHLAGVSGALTGVALAVCLPARPSPSAGPLLAQAATALAELEQAERELEHDGKKGRLQEEPVWDWATRNLLAAAARLQSPSERVERHMEPWSTYLVLPLFAFTAAGVSLAADLTAPGATRVFSGVALGLAIGKPLGILGLTWAAQRARLATGPGDASPLAILGAACLCGIGDPLSILTAEQAFGGNGLADAAKLGVLAGSVLAAGLGTVALVSSRPPLTLANEAGPNEPEPVSAA